MYQSPFPLLFFGCAFFQSQTFLQSTGPEESQRQRSPVPDISSLVTEVLTAANNAESMQLQAAINNVENSINNPEATNNEVQPNRESDVKEEVPEVTDEIEENLINKEPVVDETENNPVNNQHHDNNGPNISEGDIKEEESTSSQ